MTFSNRMKALGTSLITKFGEEVTFTRAVNGNYIPSALGRVAGTATTYAVVACPVDFNLKEIDQVTILSGEKKLYVSRTDTSNNEITPQVGDTVNLNSIDYRVLEVLTYEAQGEDCAYLLKIGV